MGRTLDLETATAVGAGRRRIIKRPRLTRLLDEMLAEDLAEWPDDAWLAIDDYQFAMDSAAAEQFVDTLATDAPLRLLVTTRRRPTWASARRRLYGEVVEFVFGEETAQLILDYSLRLGIVMSEAAGEFTLHPLLVRFLYRQFLEH